METTACRVLLGLIAEVNERSDDLQRKLRDFPNVIATRAGIDIRKYSGSAVQSYVEADVKGRNLCWWLEFAPVDNDRWQIDSEVFISHGETLWLMPRTSAGDLDQLVNGVITALDMLRASVDEVPSVRLLLRDDNC